MDSIDYKILECLINNGREKASVISEKIKLSVSSVTERIKKLENLGIIEQYTVILDQKKLGFSVIALMEVSLDHPSYFDSFVELVNSTPNISSCYYMTGDFDFMLKINTDTPDNLEKIHRTIKNFNGVANTKTHFVLKPLKTNSTDFIIK
jgi:Lrp/AsnC family leucine-responsive transcriptional regulator